MILRKPPRLHYGDLIGVVSPAAAVGEEPLRRGLQNSNGWGLPFESGTMPSTATAFWRERTMIVRKN